MRISTTLLHFICTCACCFGFHFGKAQSKWSIDVIGGIEHAYRSLQVKDESAFPGIDVKKIRDQSEHSKIQYRFGFNINRQLKNRLWVKSGVRLSRLGYYGSKGTSRWPSQHDGMGGWVPDSTGGNQYSFGQYYWFLECPLVLRYSLSAKKVSPFFEIGGAANLYTRGQKVVTLDDDRDSDSFDARSDARFNPFSVSVSFAAGLIYAVSDRYQLVVQPVFRYHLTKTYDAPVIEHLYNIGVETGFRMSL